MKLRTKGVTLQADEADLHCSSIKTLHRLDALSVFNYSLVMLPGEQPTAEQIAAWRNMSSEQRLKIAEHLYRMARKLKAASLQNQHPDWPPERVEAEVGNTIE